MRIMLFFLAHYAMLQCPIASPIYMYVLQELPILMLIMPAYIYACVLDWKAAFQSIADARSSSLAS